MYIEYVSNARFHKKGINGNEFNIPFGAPCISKENIIFFENRPICFITSQLAYDYFSRNDDGQGIKRGELVSKIISTLSNKKDGKYQNRWDKLWEDEYCHKFRRKEHSDHWLWNFDFYNAEIEDLQYILNKISEVK